MFFELKGELIKKILLYLLFAGNVFASPNVDISHPVYRYIDKLSGLNLVSDIIYGQRPYSREEIARIYLEAKKNMVGSEDIYSKKILEKIYKDFYFEIDALKEESRKFNYRIIDQPSVEYTYLGSPNRGRCSTNKNPNTAHLVASNFVPRAWTKRVRQTVISYTTDRTRLSRADFNLPQERTLSLTSLV